MEPDVIHDLKRSDMQQVLIFALNEPRYCLYLSSVERVIRAVEITPLPNMPRFVVGVINMQGQVIVVVDIRPCFDIPGREVTSNDQFILVHTSRRLMALVADSVVGIRELEAQEMADADQVLPGAMYIHGLAKVDGDLVLLCDLEQFLTNEDEQKIIDAIKQIEAKSKDKTGKRSKAGA